jgi:hypothetical protein
MSKSWLVPFPDSEAIHEGMPVFWKFQTTVEEDGIKVYALQYLAFHQTEHYAWLVPAHWMDQFGGKAEPERWLAEWKSKKGRYAIKKVAKSAERSFAFPSKQLAIESLLRRKKYHLMRLKQDIAVVTTVVAELKQIDRESPLIDYNFGHNAETEAWVF